MQILLIFASIVHHSKIVRHSKIVQHANIANLSKIAKLHKLIKTGAKNCTTRVKSWSLLPFFAKLDCFAANNFWQLS
jgi:hypothetical protein